MKAIARKIKSISSANSAARSYKTDAQGVARLEEVVGIIRECGNKRDIVKAKKIHEFIQRSGGGDNKYIANLLIQMYGKCGCLDAAFDVFNGILSPNRYSWKILLQLYVENGLLESAARTFLNMPVEFRDCDAIAWNAMVAAFSQHGHFDQAMDFFHSMPHRTAVSWNTIVAALIQAAQFGKATAAYGRMPQHNAVAGTALLAADGRDVYGGGVEDAKAVFDGLFGRDVMAWTAMVKAYGAYGMLDEAKASFDRMAAWSIVTCTALMVLFAEAGHLLRAVDLFQAMPEHHIVSYTHLIKLYGSVGCMDHAERMFTRMPERDLRSWNVLLTAKAENEDLDDAREFFELMPQWSGVSFTALLQSLATAGNLKDMRAFFSRSMPEADLVSWVVMLKGYARNGGSMDEAREAFDRMPQHGTFSANAMLAGLAQAGDLDSARTFFEEMPCRNEFSWSTMIREAWTAAAAEIYFDAMPQWDLVSCSAMVSAYATVLRGGIERAKTLFDALVQQGADLWNLMLLALAGNGFLKEAEEIFPKIPQRNVETWTAMLSAAGESGDHEKATSLFVRIPCLDTRSSNAMLESLASSSGRQEEAKSHFDVMPCRDAASWSILLSATAETCSLEATKCVFERSPQWEFVSFASMIHALCRHDRIEQAKSLFMEIPQWSTALCNYMILAFMERGLVQESRNIFESVTNKAASLWAVIVGYGRNGHTQQAMEVFDDRQIHRDTLAWNAMIDLHAARGEVDQALCTARLMDLQGMDPDELTFTTLLASCSKAGMVEQSFQCFVAMLADYSMKPSEMHYRVMVDMLARPGMVAKANELIDGMPFSPDITAWRAILSACVVHRDASSTATRAAAAMVELDLRSPSAYVMVSGLTQFQL